MVAGGRSGLRGNDHREAASDGRAPWRGARPSPDCHCLARSSRLRSDKSGTPAGVQHICYVVARRSPPPNPRRPPATLLQPFGLTDPECPSSPARWMPRPSNGRAPWATRPAVGSYDSMYNCVEQRENPAHNGRGLIESRADLIKLAASLTKNRAILVKAEPESIQVSASLAWTGPDLTEFKADSVKARADFIQFTHNLVRELPL